MKSKQLLKTITFFITVVMFLQCIFITSSAVSYSGSGTAADPYLVTTVEQLDGIRKNLSAHYKLAATIDLSSTAKFSPIGTIAKPFTGSFKCELNTDGFPIYAILNLKVHTAEGVYIDKGMSKWEAALFGGVENAVFENIYVLNAQINNDNIGDNQGSVVYNTYKPGMDEMPTAPLIGSAVNSTVVGCGATGTVDARSNHCGGLIGMMQGGSIQNCWSTVNVKTSGRWQSGGLIATVQNNATVFNCFATGNVEGNSRSGALIGAMSSSAAQNCYATGNAAHGFIAYLVKENSIANCYYTGTNEYAEAGGSPDKEKQTITNSYYLTQKTTQLASGYLQGSKAEIKAAFASIADWDTSGTLPLLQTTKKPEDFSGYKVGAVFGTPVQAQVVVPNNDSSANGNESNQKDDIQSQDTDSSNDSSANGNESNQNNSTQSQDTDSSETSETLISVKELTELINSLPEAEHITLDNKDDIKKAWADYQSLSETDKDNFDLLVYKKLVDAKDAVSIFILADVVERMENLPEASKVKKADEEEIMALYDDYCFLDAESREYISEDLRTKLEDCVKAVENLSDATGSSSALTTSEIIVLIISAAVIFINAAISIIITIILFKKIKQADSDNADYDGGDHEDS